MATKNLKLNFADLEPDNIKDNVEAVKTSKGTENYKATAKKYSPSELSESKIKELVDAVYPLLPNTSETKDRNARTKSRSKFKEALKERSKEGIKIVKEDIKTQKIKEQIHQFNPEVDVEGLEEEELQRVLAGEMEAGMDQIQDRGTDVYVNLGFTVLLGIASYSEQRSYLTEKYGCSFEGAVQ